VKLENNYHISDLVQAFPKKMVGQTWLDEWHLPICYQNPPFSWENACTKSGMCCFSVVPLIENSDG
jgi:hypothetical protein